MSRIGVAGSLTEPMATPLAPTPAAGPAAEAARRQEREAWGCYRAALATGFESLRQAEGRFSERTRTIDEHVRQAHAAQADRGLRCLIQATAPEPTHPPAALRARLAPVPA